MSHDGIAQTLNLVPIASTSKEVTVAKVSNTDNEYAAVKQNMDSIIDVGTAALSQLAEMATLSQDARVYRVLTELISAMVTANKEVIEMKKTASEIDGGGAPEKVVNNMFVGSTAELAKMIEDMKR